MKKLTRNQLANKINLLVTSRRKPMPCPVCGNDRCSILAHHG